MLKLKTVRVSLNIFSDPTTFRDGFLQAGIRQKSNNSAIVVVSIGLINNFVFGKVRVARCNNFKQVSRGHEIAKVPRCFCRYITRCKDSRRILTGH
jgi:hypothetical protein